eukprot:355943-Chlamydomonas_euryale.AAC.5
MCTFGLGKIPNKPRFSTIPAVTIRARQYIVPSFLYGKGANGKYSNFHVSPLEWDRPPTDISGVTDVS